MTLLTFSSVGTSEKSLEAPVSDRFREAVGRERVSLVLFMDRGKAGEELVTLDGPRTRVLR